MQTDPVIELSTLFHIGPFILLDVREPAAFDADHPTGAVRVPI
ncbi:MAG: rhodanese-like domain-containing protein [Thiobacillus sp.]|nr:rhodanese-like domain-containing protein [Thiobacillus sp.]